MATLCQITMNQTYACIRLSKPLRNLSRREFEEILRYLEGGGASLENQYAGLFGKIRRERGTISLAHPRLAREFLVNIDTIVSEVCIDVYLRRRRLGSVDENFIRQ